jgi:DNA polymerase III epsilon subunit-like protein
MKYAVIDLETTGLNPRFDRITEIACIIHEDGKPEIQRTSLVNPGILIPEEVAKITGITDAMVEKCDYFPLVATDVLEDVETCDLVIGHNILKFDWPFLYWAFDREEAGDFRKIAPRRMLRDTMADFKARRLGLAKHESQTYWEYAIKVLDQRVSGLKCNLDVACQFYGVAIPEDQRHRALGDAQATQKLWEAMGRGI